MGLDRANSQATKDNQFFVPQIRSITQPMKWMLYGQLQHTAERNNRPSPQHTNVRKIVPESVQFIFPEFIVSGTCLGPIVLVALMAHHTSSLTRINLRLFADHLLLCEVNSVRLYNIVPYPLNKLPRIPRHHYAAFHITSYKTVLAQHGLHPGVLRNCKFAWFHFCGCLYRWLRHTGLLW